MNFDPGKALEHRVLLLCGDEEIRRRRALDAILAQANVQKDDFDLEFTAGDTTTPVQWIASCGTAPFLSERRITVVRHLLRRELDKSPTFDFKSLPASALLILIADDEGGTEDRLARLATATTKWAKLVEKAGGQVFEFKADPKTARAELRKELTALGKTMTERAADTLLEMTGGSFGRSLDELEKLILFVGAKPQITESDVRNVVVPSREWNVYRMVDAIVAGAVPEALKQLESLVGSAARADEAAHSRILPSVSAQLRLVWQARLCLDAGCSVDNPPASVLALFPERNNLAKQSPFRRSAVVQMARKTTLDRLRKGFQILSDTDSRLKGALDSFTSIDSLERMVLDMSETGRP